ncbi:MAG TPA: hypothetical protein VIP06_09225, partial [Nocardioides sp.]
PEKLKTTVKAKLDETTDSATGTYDKLATRGETFVAKFKKAETEAPAETPAEAPKAEAAPAEKPAPAKKAPAKKTAAKKA